MQLIVGLGNPGQKYSKNRHNIGFMCIDNYLSHNQYTTIKNKNFNSLAYKINDTIFSKPQTFMNNSGISIKAIKEYYKIQNSDILVIHDDLDLDFGAIKYKNGGSSGGHNGLKSIDSHIGQDYTRARIGIGRPQDKNEVVNYVLKDFSKDELKYILQLFTTLDDVIDNISNLKLSKIQSLYTKKAL